LYNPLGIFVDSYGNIYISDYNNARVQKWVPGASSGVTIAGGNGLGTAPNQLNRPAGLWVDSKGDLYVSDFFNNRVQKFSNTLRNTYTTLAAGDYTATVTSFNGCTATSNTITVVASKTPSVTITSTGTTVCTNVTVTFTASPTNGGSDPLYQWKINGTNTGISSNNPSFLTSTLKAGDVVSCVMTSNANICLTSKTATSNLITLTAASTGVAAITIATTTTSICEGSVVTFTATPVYGGSNPIYHWKVNGIIIGTVSNATYSTTSLKDGDVVSCSIISSANLCPDAMTATSNELIIRVTKVPLTSVSITANDTLICTGSKVAFAAAAINSGSNPIYQWKINGSDVGNNSPTFSSSILNNGDFVSCSITSNMQCAVASPTLSNTIKLTVDEVPVITMRRDTVIFLGSSLRLNTKVTGNVTKYNWLPAATLDNSTIASPLATPTAITTYKLSVMTPGDCKATGQVTITTITEVIVPNAFSPNSDGINDLWTIQGLSSYRNCFVQVFNRYGQSVFQSKGYDKAWNGTFNGQVLPVGTYYYIINIDSLAGSKNGSVTLLK
jgi:gliding motility-associated-like protein